LSFVPKGITFHHFHSSNAAKRRENALFFQENSLPLSVGKQLLLLEQNLYQLLPMVINPKPDPPVVTILDSNPGLVV
jgi:hypothetical protein